MPVTNDNKEAPGSVFDDNSLAQQFIEANKKALSNDKSESFDIYQEKSRNYVHFINEPDELLRSKIISSLDGQEVLHQKFLDSKVSRDYWNSFTYRLKKIFLFDPLKHASDVHLHAPDWSYYSSYQKRYKHHKNKYLNDFYTFSELHLRSEKKLNNMLFYEVWLFLLGLGIFTLIYMALDMIRLPSSGTETFSLVGGIKSSIFSINIVALLCLLVPYVLFLSMWFINVNNVHQTKTFHYLTISTTGIAYFLFASAAMIWGIYHLINYLDPITTIH